MDDVSGTVGSTDLGELTSHARITASVSDVVRHPNGG
jgi:hypothetical protein